ncbi:hypothetical protein VNO78_22931 [Psophocarpus tetragonolobus]|uniref:Uncharacterized protein n=1 Tax=Psophocarpus tetragonolobus TaxID=3891 RepID=A0AAN9XCY9_PSOTE
MKQNHRTRMQIAAETFEVIIIETVLVPPVLYALHLAGEHKQKRRQLSVLVDLVPFLDSHPGRVRPEAVREVVSEVRVTILRRAEHAWVEVSAPKLPCFGSSISVSQARRCWH